MTMATLAQLETALRNADAAGDTAAAQQLANEIRNRRAAPDPNEGMGLGSRIMTGIGRSADKLGRGFVEGQLAIADKLTGGWDWPEQARERIQAESQARDRLWEQNAAPSMRAAEMGADIAQFFVPASGAAKLTQGAKMLPRAAVQAGAAMGLDAVHQQGEGEEGVDLSRTAMTGAFAGGAEFMAPIAARLGKGAIRAIRSKFGADDTLALGRELAEKAGLTDITDDLARKIGASADEIEAGARPGSVVAEQEFGFRPTRAQKTGDFADASREDLLRQAGNRRIGAADDFNRNRLEQVVGDMTGGLDSPQTAVDNVQQAVRGAREAAKAGEREAWRFADDSTLAVTGRIGQSFRNRFESARGNQVMTDAAESVLKKVDEALTGTAGEAPLIQVARGNDALRGSFQRSGVADELAAGARPNPPKAELTIENLLKAQRTISDNIRTAPDAATRRLLGKAREAIDGTFDDFAEATILSGDPQDIQRLKDAIGTSRGVFQKFTARGKSDQVGRMVENILENGNLDQLSNAVLGSAEVSSTAGVNFARAVKRTLGDDAAALDQVRQAVILKAATRKTGEVAGMQRIASNLKTLMNQRRDLLGELFSEREISQLSRLTMALDDMSRQPGNIGRDSGTTGRAIRYLNQVAGDGILGFIPRMLAKFDDAAAARAATRPLQTMPAMPALPGAAGGYGSTQSTPP